MNLPSKSWLGIRGGQKIEGLALGKREGGIIVFVSITPERIVEDIPLLEG